MKNMVLWSGKDGIIKHAETFDGRESGSDKRGVEAF